MTVEVSRVSKRESEIGMTRGRHTRHEGTKENGKESVRISRCGTSRWNEAGALAEKDEEETRYGDRVASH